MVKSSAMTSARAPPRCSITGEASAVAKVMAALAREVRVQRGSMRNKLLAANDSYGFFSALGDLVVTGLTRTNVNDYRAILIA